MKTSIQPLHIILIKLQFIRSKKTKRDHLKSRTNYIKTHSYTLIYMTPCLSYKGRKRDRPDICVYIVVS